MVCYRNHDEVLEFICYHLTRSEVARGIVGRGRECCLREHCWLHRYQRIVEIRGILEGVQT